MAQTLVGIQAKIVEVEAAITKVLNAQAYGKGDKNVQRAQLSELNSMLHSLRRDESAFEAKAAGATNGAILSASWT